MPAPATLDWSMALNKSGDALDVHYTLKNTTDRRIYAMDLLPRPGKKSFVYDPNFFIVMNGDAAGTVAFVRGRVQSEAPVAILIDPGGRAIEPGQSVEGSGTVPLPLKGAHYQGTVASPARDPDAPELPIRLRSAR